MWEECHIAGRWVKVPAEELEWSLAPGSGGLSGLPTEEKQPEGGLQRTERFIHHVQSLHHREISHINTRSLAPLAMATSR